MRDREFYGHISMSDMEDIQQPGTLFRIYYWMSYTGTFVNLLSSHLSISLNIEPFYHFREYELTSLYEELTALNMQCYRGEIDIPRGIVIVAYLFTLNFYYQMCPYFSEH
jgi:hypothetical protein